MKRTILCSYRNNNTLFCRKSTEDPVANTPTAHIYWEMILLNAGDMVYTVNGKEYHLCKNNLVITRPLDYHALSFASEETYDRYLIVFSEDSLISNVCKEIPPDLDIIDLNGYDHILSLFRKMSHYIEQFDPQTVNTLLVYMIEEILYNAIVISKKSKETELRSVNPVIREALQYINENITRQITLEELADHLHLTKGHICKLFTNHLNTSPKQFILSQKLLMAKKDLYAGSKVTEVCTKYSFSDYSGFYRHYMHRYGHKPSDTAAFASLENDGF